MTIGSELQKIQKQLHSLLTARLEASWLMAHVLEVAVSDLTALEKKKLEPEKREWLLKAVERRLKGEPIAYIIGKRGFYKHDFLVKKGVLVPRPETELVVEAALQIFHSKQPENFADLGSGSGCIGLSLLKEWPNSQLTAIDISPTAIDVTKENAKRLEVDFRVTFIKGSVTDQKMNNQFELIVANPPYIGIEDPNIESHVKKFEPHEALFSEEDGYADLHSWSAWALGALKAGGWWITEIGAGQSEAVLAKLTELGFSNLGLKKDLAGLPRVICAQKP